VHLSVDEMWHAFLALGNVPGDTPALSHWHFCDNEHDANECARLVLSGRKRATAPSLWSFQAANEPLPQAGDLHVVTDWAGVAQCIIRISHVELVPLDEITQAHASAEGEGDGSLAWWRRAHWAYYHRELEGSGYQPRPDMPIVFQWFERVYPMPVASDGAGSEHGLDGD
jgi:uncharacterized protein YhfF